MPVHAQAGLANGILAEIPAMRAYARLMINDRSEADREVEETLKSVLANGISWIGRSQLRVALLKSLRSFLARHRNSTLQRDIPHSYGNLLALPASGLLERKFRRSHAAPGTATGDAQTVTEVGPALLRLDFGDREAIILSAAARFSDLEIAEICGCALETVRGRVHRARAQLAKILRVEFADDINPVTVPPAALEVRNAEVVSAVQ